MSDGDIACWDTTRAGGPVRRFNRPHGPGGLKEVEYKGPFSLAPNAAGDVLAAGVANEIHLWDLRSGQEKALGAFTTSHSDSAPSYGSVRALAWHPCVPHTLVSGGDDGIVNVIDTSIRGEDDALVTVINVGSAVASLGFFGPCGAYLWVVTELDGLSLWNVGSAERVAEFPTLRMQFIEAGLPVSYLLGCHFDTVTQRLALLAGGHEGAMMVFDVTPTSVTLAAGGQTAFGGAASHGNTIRAALWARVAAPASSVPSSSSSGQQPQQQGLVLFTGDEDGRLVQWVDAPADSLLRSPPSPVGWHCEWDYARHPVIHPAVDVHGILMRLPPAGSGAAPCDADSFGTRAADPISEPDENAPLGAEAAAILGAGAAGPMAVDSDEDGHRGPGGSALGKRRAGEPSDGGAVFGEGQAGSEGAFKKARQGMS